MFDWDDLRHFAAFARAGSLAGAARLLQVEHATVSRRIAALEASLALKLVDRRDRRYALTADGERIAEFAERMSGTSMDLARYVSGEQEKVEGCVTVSAPPALLATLVAPRSGELLGRYPGLRLRLVGAKHTASLSRKEADIALRLVRPEEARVVVRKLGELQFALHASAPYLATTLAKDWAFIGYDDSMLNSIQERWLDQQRQGRPVVLRSNDLRIQAEAAAGGAGVVVLPEFIARPYGLALAAPEAPWLMREVWLAYHDDLRNSAPVRAVADFLATCLEDATRL